MKLKNIILKSFSPSNINYKQFQYKTIHTFSEKRYIDATRLQVTSVDDKTQLSFLRNHDRVLWELRISFRTTALGSKNNRTFFSL
jgi:hypothetical protein